MDRVVTVCCMCKRIHDERNGWRRMPVPVNPMAMSHTYCPRCLREARRVLERIKRPS
jgi:hypothetical protein